MAANLITPIWLDIIKILVIINIENYDLGSKHMKNRQNQPISIAALPDTLIREPMHRQINRILKKDFSDFTAGQKIPSEHDLARRFGVSVMTVRQALAGLVNEGLLLRRRGSGTFVAKPPHSRCVAVLVEKHLAASGVSHFYFQLVRHLHLLCQERGYDCRLYVGDSPSGEGMVASIARQRFIADLEHGKVHGLLALATSGDKEWLKRIADDGFPVVGGYHRDLPYCVRLNKEEMLTQAIAWLKARGRQRLGFLAIGQDDCDAFKAILEKSGIVCEQEWTVACSAPRENAAVGYEGFLRLWRAKADHPDGLVVMDDVLCGEAIPAIIKERIRVPEDLLIISHANKGVSWPAILPIARLEVDPRLWAVALLETLSQIWEDGKMRPRVRYVPFVLQDETGSAIKTLAGGGSAPNKSLSPAAACQQRRRKRLVAAATKRTAFTLVELLVVMAIISLLAAMLLPALSNARLTAQQASCMNNQKQIGAAIMLYTNDHNGLLPDISGNATAHLTLNNGYSWGSAGVNGDEKSVGWWLLAGKRYLGPNQYENYEDRGGYTGEGDALYRCPSRRHGTWPILGAGSYTNLRELSDYAMGWIKDDTQNPPYPGSPELSRFPTYKLWTATMSQGWLGVNRRSLLMAEAVDPDDEDGNHSYGCQGPFLDLPHLKNGNVLRVDGSCKTLIGAFSDAVRSLIDPPTAPRYVGNTFMYYWQAKYGAGWWVWAERQVQ